MASNPPHTNPEHSDEDLLDADEVGEEINNDDPDAPMDDDDEDIDESNIEQEILLENDSSAHFDTHTDSIFCIASHPLHPNIILTGGGDDLAYIFDSSSGEQTPPSSRPVLPQSYQSTPPPPQSERKSITPLQKLSGHTDSVNAVAFTLPSGAFALTAGLDGKLRAYSKAPSGSPEPYTFTTEASEVEEINFLTACPSPSHPNTVALGASDGSVWVYTLDASSQSLEIVMTQYLHTTPVTAGAWTPSGAYLATVSEDGSLFVFDVFGTGQPTISLSPSDARFAVDGGLYSVACSDSLVAVGGAGGNIKVVGLPQPSDGAKKNNNAKKTAPAAASAGTILASLQAQTDGVETLAFAAPPLTLLAAGSVDGSIALFDTAHRFAVRRHVKEAHEEYAVVKVEWVREQGKGHVLVSAGMDGVVRVWDSRGGTAASGGGLLREFRGHSAGEGGGVLSMSVGGGRVVTAGDDGVSLVFDL